MKTSPIPLLWLLLDGIAMVLILGGVAGLLGLQPERLDGLGAPGVGWGLIVVGAVLAAVSLAMIVLHLRAAGAARGSAERQQRGR